MAKGKDGIREILESGQAPGFFVRGGSMKNAPKHQEFAPEHRTEQSLYSEGLGLTPEQYEKLQERGVKEAEKAAADTAAARKSSRRSHGEFRHIARVPAAEHYAERKRSGDDYWDGSDEEIKDKLKRRGRLFKHEK